MYLSATVKVPEIPGKITRRKMGTNVYVLFREFLSNGYT